MSVGSSFENSALKSSFSLSSLRTGGGSGLTASGPLCKASVERPYHSLTKKRKDPNRESWRRSWGSQYSGQSVLATDDLWAALQHNYDYIMDNHIIDTCKEANGELLASNSSVLPPSHGNLYNRQWSLHQLIMEFTDMWQWLTAMQDQIYSSPENSSNRTLRLTHMSELTQAEPRLEKLVEQAGAILARIPEASEEVVWRVKHIRVKWESVRQLLSVEDASADGDASGVVDNTEHEIRCLRRWLHTMEGRLPPPSAAAARGCSRQELLRKLHEYQVLQRDVECHGRIVGAVLRRRGEGCTGAGGGGGGLERRWQLLFLRALEWQCHLDACLAGLENREDTSCVPTDSDDEPALKQRRLSKRTSPRRAPRTTPERTTPERTTGINGHRYTPTSSCESDESYSEEDNDENYSSLVSYRYNSDSSQFDILPSGCAEHDLEASAAMELEGNERGVPGTHESTPVNEGTRGIIMGDSQLDLVDGVCCTTNDATMYDDDSANQIPVPKTPPTVIKRSKRNVNSSKFNQSGRMSKNCATYYFKHRDTDSDRQMIDTDEKTQEESSEEEWTYAGGEKQPLEGDMHLIDGEGDVAMEDQASKDKTEGCVPEKAKNIELNETQSIHNENEVAVKAKLEQNAQQNLCKENITRLVNQADEWVQKQAHHQGSPVSVKKIKVSRNFKPLSFDGEGKGVNKMSRINEWLRQHSDGKADNSLQSVDSYDASGECTTGESEADKQSVTSEEPSLDTYRNMTCSMEMSMISSTSTITPSNNTTPVHHGKVTLRKKKTNASGTRPWSVSCLSQLTLGTNEPTGVSGSSLNTTPVQPTNTTSAYSRVSGMSISESALNTIVSPSHNMMSHKLNKAKQGKVQSSTSSVKTAIQGHISSTTTINDACISCYENADPKQCSMRRKRLKLRRRQQAHLSGELDFEDIRPEQRTKMSKRQDRLVKCSSFSGQPTERIEDRLERNTASDPSSSRKNRFDTSSASGNDSDEGMTTQQPAILPCSKRTEQSTTDQDPSSAELQAENVRPSFKVGPAGGWVRGRLSLTERDKDRADMLGLNLGDPALLWDVSADKDSDIDRSIRTGGTEEHSSFSEQAWDSYQEKYNSEPYSEAPDSDAARQLLECDDYRAFLDSQSDCCSSLSAHPDHDTSPHNFTRRRPNLDDHREKSLPRYRKPGKVELTDSSLPRRIKKTSLSSAERKKNLMDSLERSKISSSADNTEIVRRRKILHDSTDRRMSKKTSLSDSFDRLNLQPHGHRRRHSSNTTSSDVNSSFEYTSINHQNRPDLLDTLNRRTRKQSANSERSRDSSELQNQADSSLNSADSRQSHNDESLESYAGDLMPVLRKRGFSLSLQVRNDAGNISDAMESDLERYDIRSHVQRSVSQLEFTESMFAKQETSPDLIRSGDYNEIIATCRKNINCLETILVGAAEGDHHILLPAYCKEIKALSARWSMLRAAAARRGGARRLRRELAALRDAVRDATQAALAADARPQLHTRHHLTRRIDELKEQLSTLLEYKVSMLKLNVSVHRLLADMGLNDPEVNVSGGVTETVCHALKDEVAELYRAWEDAHQRTSAELISLENVLESWMSWEDGLKELQLALNGDSATLRLIESALCAGHSDSVIPHVRDMANILSEKEQQKAETSGSLSDSGISDAGSDRPLSERERRLAALRRAARVLEAALAPGSHVLKAMTKRMEQTETELRTLQISCRALIMRTAARAGELKADNGGVLVRNAANSDSACPKTASDDPEDEPSGSSFPTKRWLWRIFKSALPFQLCMLALLCAAYLLDHPRCCDAVNNLGMSFSPQLRYVRGPPPI